MKNDFILQILLIENLLYGVIAFNQSAKTRETTQIEDFIYRLLDNLVFLRVQTSTNAFRLTHWLLCLQR